MARRTGRVPSLYLLTMAFSAHLGGLLTLIGEPINLIVPGFRAEYVGEPFGVFAFTPIGLAVSVAGVAFIALTGWHLIPRRQEGANLEASFSVGDYLAEVEVPRESDLAGLRLAHLREVTEADVWIAAIVRNARRISNPTGSHRILAEDELLSRWL